MHVQSILVAASIILVLSCVSGFAGEVIMPADEPLMDWSSWEKYRGTVRHPAGYINASDLANAREHIKRYQWAQEYVEKAEAAVTSHLSRCTPEFLEQMIPANSVQRCYQCPACRDRGLARHPGGSDLLISQLDPAEIEIDTPAGKLRTDAALAVISVAGGRATRAALAEGTILLLNDKELPVKKSQPDEQLGDQAGAGRGSVPVTEPWTKPMWVVHRGGEEGVPENTMVAIRHSVEMGAEYIEIDLHATADAKIVLLHDDTLDRTTTGAGKLSEHTWEQVKDLDAGSWKDPKLSEARIPLLSEVLAYCKEHNVKIVLDLKDPQASGAELYDLLAEYDMVQDARVYMRAGAAQPAVKAVLDPRLVQFPGSLVQPWGKTPPAEKMQQALDNEKSMGALLRSYRAVLDFYASRN
jgi:hypothetical protein